jgi:uncharacterized protein YkwD
MFVKRSGVPANSQRVNFALMVLLVALAATLLVAAPARAEKKQSCKDAGLVATGPEQSERLQQATRCLINRERTKRGLKSLKTSNELLKASDWQNRDMLEHSYFDHARPDGPEFAERILRFGYADDSRGYSIGENLAWASQQISTPRKMVSLWMKSPPHRRNILTKDFRDQAVSAVWSAGNVGGAYANSGGPFVVYTNQFGARL